MKYGQKGTDEALVNVQMPAVQRLQTSQPLGRRPLQMLVNQGVKLEDGDLALSAVPCKEDNPEECAQIL